MEQREFLKMIRACRRRMNIAGFLEKSVSALIIGIVVGILFQAAALFIPLYYANLYMILALLLAEMSVFAVMLAKPVTMEQTALKMDGFGFEERIITAYEHLNKEGTLIELQREDAVRELKAHKDRIRISLWPSLKKTALLLLMSVLLLGLSLLPSAAKDRAGELHSLKEEAQVKEDEIEEIMEELDQLDQEKLTKEQQAVLNEMRESLESSLTEFQQAFSEEMLAAASQKLDYKYENMSGQLSEIIQDLQNGAGVSAAAMDSMQEMADKLDGMSGARSARGDGSDTGQGSQKGDGTGSENGQGGQRSDGGAGSGSGQEGQNGQGGAGDENGAGGENGQDGDGGSGNGRGTGSGSTPHDYVSVPNDIADSGNLTGNVTDHDTSEYFRAQNGLGFEGTHIPYDAVIGSYEQKAYEGIAAGQYPSGMEEIIKEYFASFN